MCPFQQTESNGFTTTQFWNIGQHLFWEIWYNRIDSIKSKKNIDINQSWSAPLKKAKNVTRTTFYKAGGGLLRQKAFQLFQQNKVNKSIFELYDTKKIRTFFFFWWGVVTPSRLSWAASKAKREWVTYRKVAHDSLNTSTWNDIAIDLRSATNRQNVSILGRVGVTISR